MGEVHALARATIASASPEQSQGDTVRICINGLAIGDKDCLEPLIKVEISFCPVCLAECRRIPEARAIHSVDIWLWDHD